MSDPEQVDVTPSNKRKLEEKNEPRKITSYFVRKERDTADANPDQNAHEQLLPPVPQIIPEVQSPPQDLNSNRDFSDCESRDSEKDSSEQYVKEGWKYVKDVYKAREDRIKRLLYSGSWKSNCPDLNDVMSKAKDDNAFTDIEFVIGREPLRKTFHAHKVVLACGNVYFQKMFYGPLAEKKNTIEIEDDDPEAFDMLLNYIYGKGDKLETKSFLSLWKIYSIADKYLAEGLADDVKQFIKSSSMKDQDFWDLNEYELFMEEIFKEKISDYIQKNARLILKSEKFLAVSGNFVVEILQMDSLNISELELLQSITKWGNLYFDAEEKAEKMKHLLQHIRFSNLTVTEFLKFTDDFPDTIDTKSCWEILKFLENTISYKLPDWCSTKDDSRARTYRLSILSTYSDEEEEEEECSYFQPRSPRYCAYSDSEC